MMMGRDEEDDGPLDHGNEIKPGDNVTQRAFYFSTNQLFIQFKFKL